MTTVFMIYEKNDDTLEILHGVFTQLQDALTAASTITTVDKYHTLVIQERVLGTIYAQDYSEHLGLYKGVVVAYDTKGSLIENHREKYESSLGLK